MTNKEAIKFGNHNDWIACADELPEKHDMYLVTWTGHLGSLKPEKWLDMLEFFPDEEGKEGEGWAVYDLEKQGFKNIQVIAWQDLPEVY